MLSLTHTLISLPLGVYLESPFAIVVAAFVLHLLADTLLHWNVYPQATGRLFYPLAALDVIGGGMVAWLVMGNVFFTPAILLAILGGNLPDILQGLWDLVPARGQTRLRALKPFFDFHDKLQFETNSIGKGIMWQAILIIVAVAVVS